MYCIRGTRIDYCEVGSLFVGPAPKTMNPSHIPLLLAYLVLLTRSLAAADPVIHWSSGATPREFTRADDVVLVDVAGKLREARGATVEAWVLLRRPGEQAIVARGLPSIGPGGERFYRRAEGWVNFFIGTDQHGFLMGCVNGNSRMPFPLVTLELLKPDEWHQIVVVKQADGYQRFHHNGALVHSDASAAVAGQPWPFSDAEAGEPMRIAIPLGGSVREVSVWARELEADEIRAQWESRRGSNLPNSSAQPVDILPMHEHPSARPLVENAAAWQPERSRILREWGRLLGPNPETIPPLDAQAHGETDCGTYVRREISIQVQPDERMPCWPAVWRWPCSRCRPVLQYFVFTTRKKRVT